MGEYDVIVVGGSFAGLNFSRVAAINGLKVLILEKQKEIAEYVASTGIFIKEIPEIFQIPKKFCTNAICTMHIYSPSNKSMSISSKVERFYTTKTKEYLNWLAEQCQKWGVDLSLNSNYITKTSSKNFVKIKFKKRNKLKEVKAKFIVGADGALSNVANSFNLSKNKEFLFGTEQVLTNVKGVKKDSFYCFLDYKLAPRYMCWVAPNQNKIQIGLAGNINKFNPAQALKNFKKRLNKYFDFSQARLIEKRRGLIPVGGILDKTVTDKCLLLGNAAGMVTAFAGGGIFPSLSYSIKAGECVADYILNKNKESLKYYTKYSKGIKDHLKVSRHLRTIYNTLNSNELLEDAFNILKTKEGKKLIKNLYFGGPAKGHSWRTIFLSFEEFLRDPKVYPLFGKLILDEIMK